MELVQSKAIVGVPMPGSYFPINYFSNTHPLFNVIIEIENYKIYFSMFLIKSQLDTVNSILRLHYYDNRHKDECSKLISLYQNRFSHGSQAFTSSLDMASSGVWKNIYLTITPTFVGVCGMLFFIILVGSFSQTLANLPYIVFLNDFFRCLLPLWQMQCL